MIYQFMMCPDCSIELIAPENPHVGSIIVCVNCGAEIEITSMNPMSVQLIEETK